MSLRRSTRKNSDYKKANLKEKIKKVLNDDENGIIIESYGEKGKGIKVKNKKIQAELGVPHSKSKLSGPDKNII